MRVDAGSEIFDKQTQHLVKWDSLCSGEEYSSFELVIFHARWTCQCCFNMFLCFVHVVNENSGCVPLELSIGSFIS